VRLKTFGFPGRSGGRGLVDLNSEAAGLRFISYKDLLIFVRMYLDPAHPSSALRDSPLDSPRELPLRRRGPEGLAPSGTPVPRLLRRLRGPTSPRFRGLNLRNAEPRSSAPKHAKGERSGGAGLRPRFARRRFTVGVKSNVSFFRLISTGSGFASEKILGLSLILHFGIFFPKLSDPFPLRQNIRHN
jgi:hypothetical protein